MCGILGSNYLKGKQLRDLNDLLNHRGPDQEGYYTDKYVGLAHKRLSILDLSDRGRQPMYTTDKNYIIIFNGEIFNFSLIKSELESLGYKFNSQTDTEIVLNSYIEWGTSCLKRFNGQFAFAIYDKRKSELFLARDRFGEKPLYYYFDGEKFIFASELKVMLKAGIKKEVNRSALQHYLLFGMTPGEQSIINEIKKLPAAHYLFFNLKEKKLKGPIKYWKIEFSNKIRTDDIKGKVYNLLDQSVKLRMIADVPVGAFLSGGIDSSIIVYLMSQYTDKLKTFSIEFEHKDFDESQWASSVAKKLGTDHYNVKFTAKNVRELIPDLIYAFDEPFGDPSMIPTFLVSKVASQHVKVCLSGTGGDELFIGYPRYKEYLLLNKLNHLPRIVKRLLVTLYSLKSKDRANKLQQLFKEKSDNADLYLKLFSYLYRDDNELDQSLNDFYKLKKHFKYKEELFNVLNYDQHVYLTNDLLVKEDRATMAWSLEGRMPFLDHELVELVNNIDINLKFRQQDTKHLLKEIFKDKLPSKILHRRKRGFGVPLKHYFRNELKKFAYETIFYFDSFAYYDKGIISLLWKKHQTGESDYSHLFWSLISFNLWYQKWIES